MVSSTGPEGQLNQLYKAGFYIELYRLIRYISEKKFLAQGIWETFLTPFKQWTILMREWLQNNVGIYRR